MPKLSQNIEKSAQNVEQRLKGLSQEKFACAADAKKALAKISKQFKDHQVNQIKIIEKMSDEQNELPDKYYQISATIFKNEKTIQLETQGAGRFIIATNI